MEAENLLNTRYEDLPGLQGGGERRARNTCVKHLQYINHRQLGWVNCCT